MLKETYDNLARNYDDMYSDPSDKVEDKELFGLLKDVVKGKTLDIGCGTGILLDYLEVPDYYGIDPSREMLWKLDQKHPERSREISRNYCRVKRNTPVGAYRI